MSRRKEKAIWALIVIVGTTLVLASKTRARRFNGKEICLSSTSGWFVGIEVEDPESPLYVEGHSSDYFRLQQGDTHLFGVPGTPRAARERASSRATSPPASSPPPARGGASST